MSAEQAAEYIGKMIASERKQTGDLEPATRRVSRQIKAGFWQVEHLRKGKAKTVSSDLLERIKRGYEAYLEKQIALMELELGALKENSNDGRFEALETKANDLVSEIKKAKELK